MLESLEHTAEKGDSMQPLRPDEESESDPIGSPVRAWRPGPTLILSVLVVLVLAIVVIGASEHNDYPSDSDILAAPLSRPLSSAIGRVIKILVPFRLPRLTSRSPTG